MNPYLVIPAVYLALLLPQLALCLAALRNKPTLLRAVVVNAVLLGCGGALTGIIFSLGGLLFLSMQLAAWLLFLLWPTLLLGGAWLLRTAHPRSAKATGLLGGLLVLTAAWSMGVEPRWLETTTHRIPAPGLEQPLTVVLVADVQTERWGRFERRAFERATAAQPDLVLFAGDYLQPSGMPEWEALLPELQAAVRQLCGSASLGCVAVRGDVDPDEWPWIFEGSGAHAETESRALALGPVSVTALAPGDTRLAQPPVQHQPGYHIVLGHAPDFATTGVPADLLLAGHIHGGQVRIPGYGPLLTLSRVPRAWATGLNELPDGAKLIVSRGLGLERGAAPRLRLFCRPELVVIELVPDPTPSTSPRSTP